MVERRIVFEEKRPYHLLTRAVEKRNIFISESDCSRFLFQIYTANVGQPVLNVQRQDIVKCVQSLLAGEKISSKLIQIEHAPLIHLLGFVLVGNHYHLLAVQNLMGGIPKFMQKLNTAFAKYFNVKNERKGALFESRYKIVGIEDEHQLDAIVRYINLINTLDVFQPGWRERGLKDPKAALNFLNEYQFSSFPDLFGKRKSLLLASESVLDEFLGESIIKKDPEESREFIQDYLRQNQSLSSPLFLE